MFVPFGFSRREFLAAGMTWSSGRVLLGQSCALAANPDLPPETSVIFVTLGGGPSQFETYDPKPNAPAEYRGERTAISTRLPGVFFSDLFPRQASICDQLAIVRSVQHQQASHIAEHIIETGYDLQDSAKSRTGEMPSVGSVVSKVRGRNASGIPGYVSMPAHHGYAGPHWLGNEHRYFAVDSDPATSEFEVGNLTLDSRLSIERLADRRELCRAFDAARRITDLQGHAESLDKFGQQAFDLISEPQARQAFEIDREPPPVRERFGWNTLGQRLLLARRLVEAGVPFVTVRMGDWDDHALIFERIVKRASMFDVAITALIEDLRQRGLRERVLVVAMGEFGRTPRVNQNAGRDHWPAVNSVLLSGGRYRMGQVIGSTDAQGGRVLSSPYSPQSVLSMVYRHLGIDPVMTFNDYSGRPRYVLEDREPIVELLG